LLMPTASMPDMCNLSNIRSQRFKEGAAYPLGLTVKRGFHVVCLSRMSNKMSENERRIVYLSVLVVVVLAILLGLSNDQTYSAVTVLFIVIVVIGNIIYIYRRMKHKPEEKKAGTD
jgi:hypothetical protein